MATFVPGELVAIQGVGGFGKLRYFAGMTNEEVAQLLGISISTTKNHWNFSRGWLFNEIKPGSRRNSPS